MAQAAGTEEGAPRLPPLRADLRLERGAPDEDGSPMWMLFDPLRNRYFHLHLRGLRLLRHWRAGATPAEVAAAARGSGLTVDADDVDGLVRFMLANGLTVATSAADAARLREQHDRSKTRWWQWLLHRYLFFRIPLVRPDPFLARTLPRVRWLGGPMARRLVIVLGLIGIILALRQWEVFVGTFLRFLSWDGIIWYALALVAVKAVHELAHAWVAKSKGCRVPTMGIAFLVLFPFLYTDATDTWRLARNRDRLAVAMAGVTAELAIALLATFAWGFLADGPVREAAFFLATTSWVTSLLINLSPFMRFDGYHALSDLWGIHNLQPRAFELARWRLREALFGFGMPPPESFRPRRRRLLVVYAVATWIYRFFLFLGIALLVYHFAFKALGIVLFVVEIGWFIGRPIVQEIVAMIRHRWHWNRQTVRTLLLAGLVLLALFLPWRGTMPLPAVLDAVSQARLHTPEAARVASVEVDSGERVQAGDVLVRLEKPQLALEAEQARHRIALLQARLDRRAALDEDLAAGDVLRRQLVEQRIRLAGLRERERELVIRSPIAGVVARRAELRPGQWVGSEQLLAEVVDRSAFEVIAYVREQERARVEVGSRGRFMPDDGTHTPVDLRVTAVEDVGSERLPYPMLASTRGGPLPVTAGKEGEDPQLDQGVYRVRLEPVVLVATPPGWRLRGYASIEAPPASIAGRALRHAAAVLIRETGF
ncbi:MAG: HlyD family efflux transporter periplasmic adaptor subunit [Halofilum sp. (in: g-proteobacteria)]